MSQDQERPYYSDWNYPHSFKDPSRSRITITFSMRWVRSSKRDIQTLRLQAIGVPPWLTPRELEEATEEMLNAPTGYSDVPQLRDLLGYWELNPNNANISTGHMLQTFRSVAQQGTEKHNNSSGGEGCKYRFEFVSPNY